MCAKTVLQGEPFPHSLHIKGFSYVWVQWRAIRHLSEAFSTVTEHVRFLSCEIQPVHPKGNQSWILIGKADVETETPIPWSPEAKNWLIGKDPDAGEDWKQEEMKAEDDRGWDGWMASPTQWTWVWASSGSWWWTGKPGVLQSMGLQWVGHGWATELTDRC